MSGHLGTRVSLLLDGRLSAEEAERAWDHVHGCHACRDLVEREGWVKTRLAGLSCAVRDPGPAPDHLKDHLKGRLLAVSSGAPGHPLLGDVGPKAHAVPGGHGGPGGPGGQEVWPARPRVRRVAGLAAIGGSAAGAAVMGVLALGAAPAGTTFPDRAPTAQLVTPSPTPPRVPGRATPTP